MTKLLTLERSGIKGKPLHLFAAEDLEDILQAFGYTSSSDIPITQAFSYNDKTYYPASPLKKGTYVIGAPEERWRLLDPIELEVVD
jgi:hypothetical protein